MKELKLNSNKKQLRTFKCFFSRKKQAQYFQKQFFNQTTLKDNLKDSSFEMTSSARKLLLSAVELIAPDRSFYLPLDHPFCVDFRPEVSALKCFFLRN